MRRPRVGWMTRADDTILEFLLNEPGRPIRASPAVVESNITYGITTCRQRMRELEKADLLEYYDEDSGIYQITELGGQYLRGELTADEVPEPE